jgi:SAM-dependent methyltransferase
LSTEGELFNLSFLHSLREQELEEIIRDFSPGARVLDFGGGTGHQARILRSKGFDVFAVDLASSEYAGDRVFDVIEYDGHRLPLPDDSVDIIFSSNVLEHVENLPEVFSEFERVLKSDGIEIHVMPTPAWRLWTFIAGVPTAAVAGGYLIKDLFRGVPAGTRTLTLMSHLKTAVSGLLPIGHGTSSEGISELWTFSARAWRRRFRKHGHEVVDDRPLNIFYTGHMLLGARLSFPSRRRLSRSLGSAIRIYRVKPTSREAEN